MVHEAGDPLPGRTKGQRPTHSGCWHCALDFFLSPLRTRDPHRRGLALDPEGRVALKTNGALVGRAGVLLEARQRAGLRVVNRAVRGILRGRCRSVGPLAG